MYDLKVSHKESIFTKFACYLSSIYTNGLKLKRENFHNDLGMDIDFSENGSVKVSILKYVKKIKHAFPEEIMSTSNSPEVYHLFQIRE